MKTNNKMRKADNFNTVELGTTYEIPKYRVVDGVGIQQIEDALSVTFVRGDKHDNGIAIPRVDGITHEQLLGLMIEDLQYKNSLIPSRESSLVITNLQQALMWLEERTRLREKAGTLGTYNK